MNMCAYNYRRYLDSLIKLKEVEELSVLVERYRDALCNYIDASIRAARNVWLKWDERSFNFLICITKRGGIYRFSSDLSFKSENSINLCSYSIPEYSNIQNDGERYVCVVNVRGNGRRLLSDKPNRANMFTQLPGVWFSAITSCLGSLNCWMSDYPEDH